MDKEIWKDIEGYEGLYQVSNLGRIKSVERKVWNGTGYFITKPCVLKLHKNNKGYLMVGLCKNGKLKKILVHRLVAKTFISNPKNLPQVNHKDEDKTNNCIDNLEWCTNYYNENFGTHHERISDKLTNGKTSKKVYQYTLNNELIKIWPSTAECGRNGFTYSAVSACCRGKLKTHKGYKWSYEK